jgi:CRP/FNR family transcriptional regulator
LIKDFACFRDLSDDQINEIAKFTDAVCYQPGHVLFNEGEDGKSIFLLVEGDVEVFYTLGEGLLTRMETVSGQEIIGCSALVKPFKYTSTDKCLTEIQVLEVDVASLRQLMEKDCQVGLKIQQHIIEGLMGRILDMRLLLLSND